MFIERVIQSLRARYGRSSAAGVGGDGENAAANFLRAAGYRILGRNYRTAAGEIDLVCKDGDILVFVEVKTRADTSSLPESAVTPRKQRQISRVAEHYMARFGTERPAFRHDVVAVHWQAKNDPIVHHYPSFFEHCP